MEENEVYGIISDTYKQIGINDFRPTVDDVRLWIEMADTDKNGTVSIFEYENLILNSLEKAGIEIKRFTKINWNKLIIIRLIMIISLLYEK